MTTEKLYYKDSYMTEVTSKIEQIVEKDNRYYIVLDKTPFYPEGGGQPCDLGFIDDIEVLNVYEEDEIIYHVLEKKPQNSLVNCSVDYKRRLDHTQQHSGEHLLSGTIFRLYNGTNAGFRMGENYLTIDITISDMTDEMIKIVEDEANRYIYKNEPVSTYFLPKDEANKLPLRKAITVDGNIRIVQMGQDGDFCACCGTHVKYTGEIGIIKIIKAEKYKGMTRLYVKCGQRALEDYRFKHNVLTELGKIYSSDSLDILDKIKAQKQEVVDLKAKVSELYNKIAETEAKRLDGSEKVIVALYEDDTIELLEKIYEKLKTKDYILILASMKDKKLIFSHNGSFDLECGRVFKETISNYNGRGGGSATKSQGSFEDTDKLKEYIEYLREEALKYTSI